MRNGPGSPRAEASDQMDPELKLLLQRAKERQGLKDAMEKVRKKQVTAEAEEEGEEEDEEEGGEDDGEYEEGEDEEGEDERRADGGWRVRQRVEACVDASETIVHDRRPPPKRSQELLQMLKAPFQAHEKQEDPLEAPRRREEAQEAEAAVGRFRAKAGTGGQSAWFDRSNAYIAQAAEEARGAAERRRAVHSAASNAASNSGMARRRRLVPPRAEEESPFAALVGFFEVAGGHLAGGCVGNRKVAAAVPSLRRRALGSLPCYSMPSPLASCLGRYIAVT